MGLALIALLVVVLLKIRLKFLVMCSLKKDCLKCCLLSQAVSDILLLSSYHWDAIMFIKITCLPCTPVSLYYALWWHMQHVLIFLIFFIFSLAYRAWCPWRSLPHSVSYFLRAKQENLKLENIWVFDGFSYIWEASL